LVVVQDKKKLFFIVSREGKRKTKFSYMTAGFAFAGVLYIQRAQALLSLAHRFRN
jgi:hypothetical protein